ncbi:hypothetical protein ACU686_21320 [Yinghuangia aomiensis]
MGLRPVFSSARRRRGAPSQHDRRVAGPARVPVRHPAAIAHLEREFGVQLLVRTTPRACRSPRLGERFLGEARALLAHAGEIAASAKRFAGNALQGRLRVGCAETIAPYYLPPLLAEFLGRPAPGGRGVRCRRARTRRPARPARGRRLRSGAAVRRARTATASTRSPDLAAADA